MINPAEILEEDSSYLDMCIELIDSRVKVEMLTYKKEEVGTIKVNSLRGSSKNKEDTGGIGETTPNPGVSGEVTIRKTGENDLRKETEGIATKKRQGITEKTVSQKGGNGMSLTTNREFEMLSVNSQLKQQALKFKQIKKENRK